MKINHLLGFLMLLCTAGRAWASGDASAPSAKQPAVSLDHSKLVFVSDIAGSQDLWIADMDGQNQVNLTPWPDSQESEPDWSPDGQHIVFLSNRDSQRPHIWVINADGTNPTQLSFDNARESHPRYSPADSSIVYVSQSSQRQSGLLMISTIGAEKKWQPAPTLWGIGNPAWSPDGRQLVYVDCSSDGKACNLFRINADGSDIVQLTSGNFHDGRPDWGTQGIIFLSNRENNEGLLVIQPDGTGLQHITAPDLIHAGEARWISGTSGFVFTRYGTDGLTEGDSDIWAVTAIGAPAQRLTHTPPDLPPIANAGPGQTVRLGSLVTLDGSASKDPEANTPPLSYDWWQDDTGIGQSLTASYTAHPQFIPLTKGVYTFGLTVMDYRGHVSTNAAKVNITVPILGDIDGDGDVDNNDLAKITASLNKPASNTNDLRDINGDLKIDALDTRKLVLLCSKPRCAL